MSTPDYVLIERFICNLGTADPLEIQAGSFVRPIKLCYVPLHVKEKYKFFSDVIEVYCYTHYGIFPINKKLIRKAEGGEIYGP